jgi:hypothetical protein
MKAGVLKIRAGDEKLRLGSEKLGWLKDSDCVQERVPDSGVSECLMALVKSLENR